MGQERCSGGSLLVGQGLGVGESRESVDGRVQVGVAALRASCLRSIDGLGLVAVAAVDAPAAAIGDPAGLLHIEVHHVSGPAGGDLPGLAVVFAAGVDESSSAQSEPGQVAGDGAAVDREPEVGELIGDALSGPLVLASPGLDLLDGPGWCGVRAPVRAR